MSNNPILRLLIGAGLLLGLLAGSTGGTVAHEHFASHDEIYFPWVPNGAMIGESGPYYGTITIQNLEEEPVHIYSIPMAELGGPEPPMLLPRTLGGLASMTLTPNQLGISSDTDGSGVTVQAEKVSDGSPARIAGVQKQSANESPDDHARTSDAHSTVGGYSALTETTIKTHLHLPIVQTNSEWNTVIRVTNFDESVNSNTVRVALREAGGGSATTVFTEVLSVGETGTFDLLARGVAPGWVGSAEITADGNVGAVAERVKPSTNMLIINTSRPQPRPFTEIRINLAPLILRDWSFWNTGISLVNVSDRDNPVTINYYTVDGEHVDTQELTLAPGEMNFIYTPASDSSGEQDSVGFVGSAHIRSEYTVHGAVDQVKYFGADQDTGHAMSYMLSPTGTSTDEYLVLPLVQKGDPNTGLGDTTGIQLFNRSSSGEAMAEIWYLDQLGNPVTPEPRVVRFEANQGYTAYTMFEESLPPGFQGSAIIKILGGQVVAAANNVNYAVQYDGSASFNLFSVTEVLQPREIFLEVQPNPVPYFSEETTLSVTVQDAFARPLNVLVELTIDEGDVAGFTGFLFGMHSSRLALTSNGEANVGIRIRDSALGQRPVTVTVKAETSFYELEDQIDITWLDPPTLAPPDFSGN